MQRVTNCILLDKEKVLLLKKPRRGWYAIPGGKMEQGESIKESVVREYQEETELQLIKPSLAGAFTFSVFNDNSVVHEWMMFTFICKDFTGELTEHCNEGELEWVALDNIKYLPMAEGDRKIFEHVLSSEAMLYGSFSYTENYELIKLRLDPTRP
ncbi:NUDIX hydrolase [Virgibacillus litoralis]|uniref:8-oxo-dGTP diphosphatase n=1 Tax=Virgibacillus litoralis TaxID=578221 RepID=A0ABS4HAN0_9BACI|nr:8-oxo-dGTP diphosphatase [Virgibacillus litoralis]MBP1947928.1 8-oxo-dGTP diphosphatase [Virgibacillus litoralis]